MKTRMTTGGVLNDRGAMVFAHLLRLSFVLAFIFAVFWGIHTAVLLKTAKDTAVEEANRRLMVMTQTIAAEVQSSYQKALADPVFLWTLSRQYGAYRVSILEREGRILMDTLNQDQIGRLDPLRGTTPVQVDRIWKGDQQMTAPYSDRSGTQVRSYFMPIRDINLKILSILRADIEMGPLEKSGPAAVTALLLKAVGVAMILVLSVTAIRALVGRRRVTAESEPQRGETATVVDTFHGLVRQLKEKELELERLRTLAEERTAEVESYNENILQSVTSGVITFNMERVITTFNHAAERILSLSRSAAIGQTGEGLFGRQSGIVDLLDQALTRHTTIVRRELELTRPNSSGPDPQRIWVGVSTSLLRDHQDQVIGAIFVFTDLTEIKGLQEQVELKRRLTVLGEMSAGIAHEFRNYMGSVMGFTKLLSKKLPPSGSDKDTGQDMVASIMGDLTAMNHLIEQLLSFGRHTELNLQPVALEPLIRQLLDQLMTLAKEVRPHLEVAIPLDLPKIRMDEVLMHQAISNLFQNALDAMPEGGRLQVRVTIPDRSLAHPTGIPGHRKELSLEIQDTGAGIPEDKLDKIFLPFFTTKEKGTGMGLALVHKIILLHSGRVEVDSREGRGTTFRVLLPMTEEM